MLKFYFPTLLLLVTLHNTSASAQVQNNPAFTGVVWDASFNIPLEGATVKNKTGRETAVTNEQGRFSFKQMPPESDSIVISAIGYEEKTIGIKEVISNRKTFLKPHAVQLQEMVVVAGGNHSSNIISKLDVKVRGINNTQEVLRIVPGLFIGQHAGGGKAEQIFLRGFDIDHGTDITISVDGMPVNMVSHAHGQGYADLHFVIPELIQDVQFKKGTYEAAKGNFATAGFVDFRTKTRLQESSLKVEAGQFNTLRSVAMINLLNKEDKSLYVAGEHMFTRGYFEFPQNFNRTNLVTKYGSKIGSNTELLLTGSVFTSRWNASGQVPERAVEDGTISFFGAIDPAEGGTTSRSNINVQFTPTLSPFSYIKNQLYYTKYKFDLFSNFTFFLVDPVNGDQIKQKENRNLLGYNGSYHNIRYIGSKTLTSEVGINVRADRTKGSELSRTKDRATTVSNLQLGNVNELNTAVYINERIRWSNLFSAGIGLRLDHFAVGYKNRLDNDVVLKTNTTIASPKLNLFLHPSATTEVYLSAGKGFHANDTRVVLDGRGREALPAAYGADFGVTTKLSKKLFLQSAVWQLLLDQEFVYVGDEGIVEPGGKTVRKGIDLSIRYQPFKNLYADIDVAYAHARFANNTKGENYIPLAPKLTATGGLQYKTEKGWSGSLRYRYMGNRPANENYSLTAKGYFITDAVLGYAKRRYEVMVTAQNLFNTKWKETQFETESRLLHETTPVTEIHFTPGTPFFIKAAFTYLF
ncbi:MAG: TonB-dependent receptor [Bacteroidota bacterium]|nr:TonB-dependent receptor [Bacteroidota bacterium]